MKWSADQYSKFLDDRTRPARDLLAAVTVRDPDAVVDIGCGPGNSTGLLIERFPDAKITGIDSDPDMIEAARKANLACDLELARVEDWQPSKGIDVIFANASLQWVDDHHRLFPRLVGLLNPGGALAVQMPDNLDEPSHHVLREVSHDHRWSERLASTREQRKPLMAPTALHALLRPLCRRVDVWRTTYHFELEGGIDAIVDWFKGSALGPFLQALDQENQAAFLAAYREGIVPFYPESQGRVLLAFPRYFFVAEAAT